MADLMFAESAQAVAARAHRATDLLHSLVYFVPEGDEEYAAIGLKPGRMPYFASRSAPMGRVTAAVTTATFHNFKPALVAKFIPTAWSLAEPADILVARLRVADRALRRLLGDAALTAPELTELADLTRLATERLKPDGRPLFAAHADLDWPDEPHLVLWHAASLLREYRGDGHVAALNMAGLTGLEAIVTHVATGRGFNETAAKLLRGWSDDEWTAATDGLHARGFMDGNSLTAAGLALRQHIEEDTDRLDVAAWMHLGADRTQRLIELGKQYTRLVVANGAFPAQMFAGAP